MRSPTSQHQHGTVLVLGSLNADTFARVAHHPAPGETLMGTGGETRAGGKGANQALAAALCGASVTMVGAVGDDPNATIALEPLTRAGCSVDHVRTVPGPTGLALIAVADDGENTIIVIPGANAAVNASDAAPAEHLTAGDVLVLQGEVPISACTQAAVAADAAGARVMINLAPVVDYPAQTLLLANPLVVNEHEGQGALAILGHQQQCSNPEEVAQALLTAGVRSVVMTLGGRGSLVADPHLTMIDATPVTAVDTTGAGDAFAGALAARLVEGDTLEDAARWASRYAAETVQHEGAQDSYPDWRH